MSSIKFNNNTISIPSINDYYIYIKFSKFVSNHKHIPFKKDYNKHCIKIITITKDNTIIYSKNQASIAIDCQIIKCSPSSIFITPFTTPELNFLKTLKDICLTIITENPLHFLEIADFQQEIQQKKPEKIKYIPIAPLKKSIILQPPIQQLLTLQVTQIEPVPYVQISLYPPIYSLKKSIYLLDNKPIILNIENFKSIQQIIVTYPTEYWQKDILFVNIQEAEEKNAQDEYICPLSLDVVKDNEHVYVVNCCKKLYKIDIFEKYLEHQLNDYNNPYYQPFAQISTEIKCPHCRQLMTYHRKVYRKKVLEES